MYACLTAIRFSSTELIDLHERLLAAVETRGRACRIVTVGGAGALRLPGGERFWQSPAFPRATLPRGHAHAALRDHLEAGNAGDTWAYLIPPPAHVPDGPATGRWEIVPPALDETAFTDRAISYADFGAAVVEAVVNAGRGLFTDEGVAVVRPGAARRCRGEGRGLPMMGVLTQPVRKTSTCLTLPSRALT